MKFRRGRFIFSKFRRFFFLKLPVIALSEVVTNILQRQLCTPLEESCFEPLLESLKIHKERKHVAKTIMITLWDFSYYFSKSFASFVPSFLRSFASFDHSLPSFLRSCVPSFFGCQSFLRSLSRSFVLFDSLAFSLFSFLPPFVRSFLRSFLHLKLIFALSCLSIFVLS